MLNHIFNRAFPSDVMVSIFIEKCLLAIISLVSYIKNMQAALSLVKTMSVAGNICKHGTVLFWKTILEVAFSYCVCNIYLSVLFFLMKFNYAKSHMHTKCLKRGYKVFSMHISIM